MRFTILVAVFGLNPWHGKCNPLFAICIFFSESVKALQTPLLRLWPVLCVDKPGIRIDKSKNFFKYHKLFFYIFYVGSKPFRWIACSWNQPLEQCMHTNTLPRPHGDFFSTPYSFRSICCIEATGAIFAEAISIFLFLCLHFLLYFRFRNLVRARRNRLWDASQPFLGVHLHSQLELQWTPSSAVPSQDDSWLL